MKFLNLLLIITLSVILTNCKKTDIFGNQCTSKPPTTVAPDTEKNQLKAVLTVAGINFTEHSSGVCYQLLNPGTGKNPDICSTMKVNYTGKVFGRSNNFDQGTNREFGLNGLIVGWQHVMPLVKEGGKIRMFIPPSLGYGAQQQIDNSGNVTIPANSILDFTVDLISIR